MMTIEDIKNLLNNEPTDLQLADLAKDSRKGVQKLLENYYKRLQKAVAERERFVQMLQYENDYYAKGFKYIAGVDEAGRGPLAGPLVIAAVILPKNCFISGLNDSKKLSAVKREQLFREIMEKAIDIEVNIVSISNIDNMNIYAATQFGMAQVLENMQCHPQVALIDAMPVNIPGIEIKSIIHGDALSASIAAASIIAKVTRDHIMERLDKIYPAYDFKHNKGYGSSKHIQAISKYGTTRWHRRSYEPVKSMSLPPLPMEENVLYTPLLENYEYPLEN